MRWCLGEEDKNGYFYPRPPRGGRLSLRTNSFGPEQFLPTPSARRATSGRIRCFPAEADFYPRPPRGGRLDCQPLLDGGYMDFYPRPPRGGRPYPKSFLQNTERFLPTPSARRATDAGDLYIVDPSISTHALREEGDVVSENSHMFRTLFLPTPSARRATRKS